MCNTECCDCYFSEWQINKRSTLIKILLSIKFIFGIICICILIFYPELDVKIFSGSGNDLDGNNTTFRTAFAEVLWIILALALFDIYTPYQAKIFPFWWKISIMIIFTALVIFFVVAFMWMDIFPYIPADTNAFDLWTIVHTMWGVWLSFLCPFYWMCLLSLTWEILEAYTKGLGESEGIGNHIVDVVSVVIGYFIVILIFTPKDIPWITAKRGIHQCCCFTLCCKRRDRARWNEEEFIEDVGEANDSEAKHSLISE